MPQSERSETMKKMLKWISSQERGATMSAIIYHVKFEITVAGAIDKTVKNYIEDFFHAGMLEYKTPPFYKVTNLGKEWLERHGA